MSFKSYISFLNETKKPKGSSLSLSIDDVPQQIIDAAENAKKTKELEGFVTNLPGGDTAAIMLSIFNEIVAKPDYLKDFINDLWSVKSPDKVNSSMYLTNSFGSYIFEKEPKGVGRGELFLSWLIDGSAVQGGNVSFDLDIRGRKFEVKDYRSKENPNAAIRLGVKGEVTQFGFWSEIIDTIRRLDKLTGASSGITKFDLSKTFDDKQFTETVKYILGRQKDIIGGKFNKTDHLMFKKFYDKVSSVHVVVDGYTNVILRGPAVKPVEMSIKVLPVDQANQKVISIEKADQRDDLTYVLAELRRLKYSRDPKSMDKDLQDIVNSIVGSIPFIIFRNDGINVTTDFIFDHISQGGIKIVEKSVAAKRR
jgi:hypothetical protein